MVIVLLLRQGVLVIGVRLTADDSAVCFGGEADLPSAGGELLEHSDGRFNGVLNFGIDFVPELTRQTQAQSRGALFDGRRIENRREAVAVDVVRVVAGNSLEHECSIGCSTRHGPNMVERPGERNDAPRADEAVSRLVAGDSAEGRRQPDRAGGISADGAVAKAGGDGRSRAGGRSPGDVRAIPWIARGAKVADDPAAAVSKLVQVEFPQKHCPCGPESANDFGVGSWNVIFKYA